MVDESTSTATVANFVCVTCNSPTSGAHQCSSCKKYCHALPSCCELGEEKDFGTPVTCLLCCKVARVKEKSLESKRKQEEQKRVMLTRSRKRFKSAHIDDTVLVPVPAVNRGRVNLSNVKAVITESYGNNFFKLGTKYGTLKQRYSRNQFTVCTERYIRTTDVPSCAEISLRELVKKESATGGQGMFKCNCKSNCRNFKCKCFAAKEKCNSRCHSNRTCRNKTE
ncbi:uncharacterized protein TRIADDRAFT_60686 [Trichoplax adhaerens]|uniref:CRC domain-containing protein n=1 Tax=Trichoplax adhaerens TaxID=10228 RepID=B3S939_TRIAD|nr:hypothetical protein TRIADDRAFT_60686 [Trichoplax adhaerens]EDV20733.1 hypothetical protein TRIADDRAFT_60686 [Trichoplax adhaerens]|eukprot:XP_002116674.1 hypothetical protein TRIADDRAFT_60686 [Trichoplax adhaerens]